MEPPQEVEVLSAWSAFGSTSPPRVQVQVPDTTADPRPWPAFLPCAIRDWAELRVFLLDLAAGYAQGAATHSPRDLSRWHATYRRQFFPDHFQHAADALDTLQHVNGLRETFWTETLPFILTLAANLDTHLTESHQECARKMAEVNARHPSVTPRGESEYVSLRMDDLPVGRNRTVWLTQEAAAALNACLFLNLFPVEQPKHWHLHLFYMFRDAVKYQQCGAKVLCLQHYFERIRCQMPTGLLSFTRKVLEPSEKLTAEDLRRSTTKLSQFTVVPGKVDIEANHHAFLKADFANKHLGGGVLGHGCVQEEIMFIKHPETLVGVVIAEVMGDLESIEIAGAECFCTLEGYGFGMQFTGDFVDTTPLDIFGRRKTVMLALDALENPQEGQYEVAQMLRETNKAFVAFRRPMKGSSRWLRSTLSPEEADGPASTVATGNWGCGVFGGDLALKSMLQWIAASEIGIAVHYHSHDHPRAAAMSEVVSSLLANSDGWNTVGALWSRLEAYAKERAVITYDHSFFEYVSGVNSPEEHVRPQKMRRSG